MVDRVWMIFLKETNEMVQGVRLLESLERVGRLCLPVFR